MRITEGFEMLQWFELLKESLFLFSGINRYKVVLPKVPKDTLKL